MYKTAATLYSRKIKQTPNEWNDQLLFVVQICIVSVSSHLTVLGILIGYIMFIVWFVREKKGQTVLTF